MQICDFLVPVVVVVAFKLRCLVIQPTNMRSTMRSFDSPLSISAPFYGFIKFFKLLRTDSSRNKDMRSCLTDCVILAPPYRYFGLFTWPTISLNTKEGFVQSFLSSYNAPFFTNLTMLFWSILVWKSRSLIISFLSEVRLNHNYVLVLFRLSSAWKFYNSTPS